MLAIALMVFVLRQTSSDSRWASIEKHIAVAFWGINIGLAMMVTMSLFPGGVLQVSDVVEHGYWHARSLDYIGSDRSHLIEWLRLPGDLGDRVDQRLSRGSRRGTGGEAAACRLIHLRCSQSGSGDKRVCVV